MIYLAPYDAQHPTPLRSADNIVRLLRIIQCATKRHKKHKSYLCSYAWS